MFPTPPRPRPRVSSTGCGTSSHHGPGCGTQSQQPAASDRPRCHRSCGARAETPGPGSAVLQPENRPAGRHPGHRGHHRGRPPVSTRLVRPPRTDLCFPTSPSDSIKSFRKQLARTPSGVICTVTLIERCCGVDGFEAVASDQGWSVDVSGGGVECGELIPDREPVGHFGSSLGRAEQMSLGPKMRGDAAESGQEPLSMAR